MTTKASEVDVRARFEAWATERGLLIRRAAMTCGNARGPYDRSEVQSAWEGYRAAHADLSVEEVEFCSVCRKPFGPTETRVGTGDGTMRANNGRGSFAHRHCYEAAALAKFHPTHQETK